MASTLPTDAYLQEVLARVLPGASLRFTDLQINDRRPNVHASTFQSEIVTCRRDKDRTVEVLCKYADHAQRRANNHEHRGGLSYEAYVYERYLSSTDCPTATFYGMHCDGTTGQDWLMLEHLHGAASVSKMIHQYPLSLAADWIGRFHAQHEGNAADQTSELKQYDEEYYRHWAEQAFFLADSLREEFPWFHDVCTAFTKHAVRLLTSDRTLIHGEYYPNNILIQKGLIYPVDWESAASGTGEIDLAALTECWPEEDVDACCEAYIKARWGGQAPVDFTKRLDAARLYLQLRWLGDCKEWTLRPTTRWRFKAVRRLSRRLNLT